MTLKLITAATVQPLTLAEARLHMRCDPSDTSQDAIITRLLSAAVSMVEKVTGRALLPQTWQQLFDAFPASKSAFELTKPPISVVSFIQYVDINGTTQTLNSANYEIDIRDQSAFVWSAYGLEWPVARDKVNAVQIQFVTGYADATKVPDDIKAAMLLLVAHLYENRESVIVDNRIAVDILPMGVEMLLAPYKILRA